MIKFPEVHKQAECIICYNDIYAQRVFDVHCLWDDEGYSGRPVCYTCYLILDALIPKKLDVPIKRKKTEKIGLEKWFNKNYKRKGE